MPIGHQNGARYKNLVQLGSDPNECWLWLGNVNERTGYGKKQWCGETWLAHRWLWTVLFGTIPEGLCIDHTCGNRRCVNPHHLEVVTQAENCRRGKGTKLTPEIVREIRSLKIRRGDRQEIADRYGVNPTTISDIIYRRSWADI